MNVVWLDMNRPSPGWQARWASAIRISRRGADVAGLHEEPGRLRRAHGGRARAAERRMARREPASPDWQGPVGFGGSHLAPGAPVSPVFAQNPVGFAALTVDQRGRMNVACLETS